jgi:hypothetical protein
MSLVNFNNKVSLSEQNPDPQAFFNFQNQPSKEAILSTDYPTPHKFPQTHKGSLPPFIIDTFSNNLQAIGIPTPQFNWHHASNHPWNQLLISMISKHWLLARQHGAFSEVLIES